ncbi:MAG: 50S ribosomal protein L24 [Candidatus Pacebacteria bacterium]|nr:50S ribosomal protein L24 [Candidatus Paceibacterota bacterium]MCF7857418.1 50S ribosomal protein L24 [Candidatus Paceibacterota bacterium]
MKIKKGDTVIITTGKDRGKSGKVIRSFPKKHEVLVDGVHIVSRHQKSKKAGSQGQIVSKPMPIPVSNVALKDPKTDKPVRVGYIREGEGAKTKKVRVARPSGEKI